MGVYVVTGGSGGIGGSAVRILKKQGHEVINIDMKDGDCGANLATPDGRREAVDYVHQRCPDGIDGLIVVAGVSGACKNLKLIISLNYFGAVELANGLYDLLKMKRGSCVMTVSNTISQGAGRMDLVYLMNNARTEKDEERILHLSEKFDADNLSVGNSYYVASKYALGRWVRRVSATWAANGVRINSVAPGNVKTPMTATMGAQATAALAALPIPINYGTEELMDPEDIGNGLVFLTSPQAHGINGIILFVDGGTDALLNSEKVY